MSTLRAVADIQHSLETTLLQRMSDFEAQLKSSPQTCNLEHLSQEFYSFKEHVLGIIVLLRQQLLEVIKMVDAVEMRHRRKYLLLSGIQEKEGEDIKSVVISLFNGNLVLPEISSVHITQCHRLGSMKQDYNRPVLVKFSDLSSKRTVWSKKSLLKGTDYVLSEYLTKYRQGLFIAARKHFTMRRVWSLDGTINIKLSDGTHQRVYTNEDLEKLIAAHKNLQQSSDPCNAKLVNVQVKVNTPTQSSSSVMVAKDNVSRPKRTARNNNK